MSSVTLHFDCPMLDCDKTQDVEAEDVPGEMYGADADGNRGIWQEGYIEAPKPPDACEDCGTIYNIEQLDEIRKTLAQAAEDFCYEPDYPDDY